MKKTIALILLIIPFLSEAQNKKWKDLMDLSLWHVWKSDNTTGWSLENGVLSSNGKGGDLVSNEIYGDFEFSFEFKVSPKGNSGIIYKVTEMDDKAYFATYASGPEYQIIDDANYPSPINNKQKTGANYDVYEPSNLNVVKPAGEWNSGVIRIKNNKIEHVLNGTTVVSYEYGTDAWSKDVAASKFAKWPYATAHAEGKIALQGHGDPIDFRKLKIKRL